MKLTELGISLMPLERGVRHIRELIQAKAEGFNSALAFVIQMDGVNKVLPNEMTDPEFAKVFYEARKSGKIWEKLCILLRKSKGTMLI